MRPVAQADGHDRPRLIDQLVPGVAAVVEDIFVGSEYPVGEPVVAHELPDVFGRIELGRFGRQRHQGDVVGNGELVGEMPTGRDCQEFRARLGGLTPQSMAVVKRSPKRRANWDLAMDHSRGGMIHCFTERFKTRKSSFVAASSLGKWPLALTARRSLAFSASMALVTSMKISVPARSAGNGLVPAYGATIRDEGHREHAKWAGRCTE